jgi:hypothetical protein
VAARRLIVVLVVLLAISTAVAIIAPQPAQREPQTTATEPEPEWAKDPGWPAHNLSSRLHAVVDDDDAKPKRIAALVGDQMRLDVRGEEGRIVSIPDLGLTATQSPSAPASFDIFFSRPGEFEVIDAESEEVLARIEVEPAEVQAQPKQAEGPSEDVQGQVAEAATPDPAGPLA